MIASTVCRQRRKGEQSTVEKLTRCASKKARSSTRPSRPSGVRGIEKLSTPGTLASLMPCLTT